MNPATIKIWIRQHHKKTMVFLWCFFTILWYAIFGFNFQLEGEKYIREADNFLKNQHFSQGRYLFYATTILLIVFVKMISDQLAFALLLLIGFNLFCYLRFYKALLSHFKNPGYPLAIIFLLLAFWPFQSWTMFLYTENIFYSLILLLFAQLILFKDFTAKYLVQLGSILLLLLFSRPLGILFGLPVFIFLFLNATRKIKIILAFSSVLGMLIFYFITQIVFTTTPDWTVQRSFMEENLICDIPTSKGNKQLDTISSTNQLAALGYYITHNFSHFAGLALQRLKLFFLLAREYYSAAHNLMLLFTILPVYVLVIAGIVFIKKSMPKGLFAFMFSAILLFAASIAMQCDDYHNRFFLSIYPFFIFMAVVVAQKYLSYFFRKIQ